MHLPRPEQAGVLFLIKQIMGKYPVARSAMLDLDDDAIDGGFGFNSNYRY